MQGVEALRVLRGQLQAVFVAVYGLMLRAMIAEYYGPRADTPELNAITGIAEMIAGKRGIDMEELCYISGRPYNEVARIALMLESDGFICTDLTGRCTINARKS